MKTNDESAAGYNALQKRYRVVMRIIEVLNAHYPVEEKVEVIGETLRDLLPFDQFSLGLLWLNRWYSITDEGFQTQDAQRSKLMDDALSAARWVVQHRKALCRPSISQDQRFTYDQALLASGMQSDLVIPLIADGQVIGTFNFLSKTEYAYDQKALDTANSVASAVAAVVKLFQDQLFLDGVREISEAVQGSLDLAHVLEMVLDHIQYQGYDRVRVYLYDDELHALKGVAQAGGQSRKPFESLMLPLAQDDYSRVTFAGRKARIYAFGELGQRMRPRVEDIFESLTYSEKADLPLFVVENGKDRIVGKITLDNGVSDRPILQERLDALMVYASQAAIAIRHAQLYQKLEKEVAFRTNQVRESEERFRRLAEASFEGVVVSDNGIILDANDQYCDMLQYRREALLHKPVLDLVAPQFRARVQAHIASKYEDPYESAMIRKDGTMFPVEVRARIVPYEGRLVRVSAIRDISDRKMFEQEQIRVERVNAIGELAQGVAHNFNNILVGVLGNAQLIQLRTQDEEVRADADLIVESALRAKELVHRLQVSILGDKNYNSGVDVNQAIQAAVDLTQPRWKDQSEVQGISIQVDVTFGDVKNIWGTWALLRDVMVNLILNAVEAMPEGGTLHIETAMVRDQVQIVCQDMGVGMDEETRRRVFEPFFTTKYDVGSGLGLSIVQGTVKSWGGTVTVESKVRQGTRFTLLLPSYEDRV